MAEQEGPGLISSEILRFESQLRQGWPALRSEVLDGWILGISGSYTRRANSVAPEAPGKIDLSVKLAEVETFYARANRSAVFKMTSAAEPSELDAVLAARGYARRSESIVQSLSLAVFEEALAEENQAEIRVAVGEVGRAWWEASLAHSKVAAEQQQDYRELLSRVEETADVLLSAGLAIRGQVTSVALGVVTGEIVSIGQVATDPAQRGRGQANRVLRALLAKARGQGASTALLAVEAENTSARKLYERLGFEERYRYWYREAPRG